MKTNNYHRKRAFFILILGILGFVIIAISLILVASSNNTNRFFGTLVSFNFFAIIMLVLGIAQFIPSIYKGRSVIKAILFWIMGFLWIFMSGLLFWGILPNYYKDISNALNANYSSYEGSLTNFYVSHRKTTRTYLTLEDKKFDVNGEYKPGFLIKGRKYRIEYLPHSKFVMNVYRYGN